MKFKIGETVRIKPVKGLEGYQNFVGKVGTIVERKERLTYKYTIDKTYRIKIEGKGEWGFLEVELERIS